MRLAKQFIRPRLTRGATVAKRAGQSCSREPARAGVCQRCGRHLRGASLGRAAGGRRAAAAAAFVRSFVRSLVRSFVPSHKRPAREPSEGVPLARASGFAPPSLRLFSATSTRRPRVATSRRKGRATHKILSGRAKIGARRRAALTSSSFLLYCWAKLDPDPSGQL